jgi:NitT/TauT family transport system permease protein
LVERSIYPYFVVLQTIPVLALVPLFGCWFGFGVGCRVLVCVLIALFPIVASTLFGLRSVDVDLIFNGAIKSLFPARGGHAHKRSA